jgi:acylphosphatase
MQMAASEATEHFRITGDVGAASFAAWITRHARKLGLRGAVLAQDAGQIDVIASGPPDLLDALSLGCSLGPQEVWVEKIERTPATALRVNDFSSVPA